MDPDPYTEQASKDASPDEKSKEGHVVSRWSSLTMRGSTKEPNTRVPSVVHSIVDQVKSDSVYIVHVFSMLIRDSHWLHILMAHCSCHVHHQTWRWKFECARHASSVNESSGLWIHRQQSFGCAIQWYHSATYTLSETETAWFAYLFLHPSYVFHQGNSKSSLRTLPATFPSTTALPLIGFQWQVSIIYLLKHLECLNQTFHIILLFCMPHRPS